MAAAGLASMLMTPSAHSRLEEVEDEEPMSKQLEILMERRRQEEVRKARFHWALLRNSIRNTIAAVKSSDVKNVVINHGIHHQRKINHDTVLKQVVFIKELDEYLITDGQCIRIYMSDGRKKKTFSPEEPMDNISYCAYYKHYVGWMTGGDELFLMNDRFEIVSQARSPSRIVLAGYNSHTHEYITVSPGYFVTWAFRYGARHLIPRKMNRTEFRENNMFSHMVLEGTASRAQRIFLSVHNSGVVYNVYDGRQLSYKKNLHERDITAMTYFNPLKYLVTGAIDGTIKVWDNKWHVQMVFVGHTGMVNALDIYPHGSAIISASQDKTIRVWNLDTCDEVDRATVDQPVMSLQTTLDYDVFFTYHEKTVDMWRLQHLFQIHTSIGQRVIKIFQTTHPNFSTRSVAMSRDSTVRIVCPSSGEVITTLLLNPKRGLVDVAYAIEFETMFCVLANGNLLKVRTNCNPCRVEEEWECEDPAKEACNYIFVYEYVVDIQLKTDTWGAIKRGVATKTINKNTTGDEDEEDEEEIKKKNKMNRTLLLGGRKDGYICVYDWETGKVTFKIDAHGTKGVMSMIANAKVDQLISAGKGTLSAYTQPTLMVKLIVCETLIRLKPHENKATYNVIKVWRVYPFVEEALAPLMSFFCAHLPLHMTMIKTNLCVAFQDHATATYSVVMYNLRDRKKIFDEGDTYRYDHEPGDDHTETITGLSACARLKLYASSSLDGTLRIWNETNTLVRYLKLKATPYSVGFCGPKGDLLVGIGNHLYKIPHYAYMPKSYMFRMVSMRFPDPKEEKPLPTDENILQRMNKNDLSRIKNSHSSFKFSTFADKLTEAEVEEINRERRIKEAAYKLLLDRENMLTKIRDGELESGKKPKSTSMTKKVAFNQYMKMFYDKPRPHVRPDDPYPKDVGKFPIKLEEDEEAEEFKPEKEPTGFFPPSSQATRPTPPNDSPLKAAYPITPNGFVPNSILIKLLWPEQAKQRVKKQEEWRPPTFSVEQLQAIAKSKQDREEAEERERRALELQKWPTLDSWLYEPRSNPALSRQSAATGRLSQGSGSAQGSNGTQRSRLGIASRKSVTFGSANSMFREAEREQFFALKREKLKAELETRRVKVQGDGEGHVSGEEDEFSDRIMEMDWGEDDEERKARTPDMFEMERSKSSLKKEKAKEEPAKNKFAELMAKPPTPQEETEDELMLRDPTLSSMRTKDSVDTKQVSDVSSKAPSTPRPVKPLKPITKLIGKPRTPTPEPVKTKPPMRTLPPPETKPVHAAPTKARTPTPSPPTPTPQRAITPLPGFITQFKKVEWFQNFFPNCDESNMPKPWSLENFVSSLCRLIRSAEYKYKTPVLDAVLMLHAQDDFADNIRHSVCKTLLGVLNSEKDFPTCMVEDQRCFILAALKGLDKLGSHDKDFVAEMIVQFLDGDKEVRSVVLSILTQCGLQDPHKFLPRDLDSWDIWNVEDEHRKADLHKMTDQWLDRWMTSYKLHMSDAIERMKKGQNIQGRVTRDQLKKPPNNKSILRRSVGVGTEEDQETVTTLDEQPKRGVTVTFDRPPDPSLIENATYIDALNFFCDMAMEKELEAMKTPGKRIPGSKENVVQAKNTVLVLPKIPHKPCLVRLGETHTSQCRPHRETNLHVDYRLPPMTARGYHPLPGQISGFVNSINLPMKPLMLNPFRNRLDEFDARFAEPILITLKSSQKYFVPSHSVVPQDVAPAL